MVQKGKVFLTLGIWLSGLMLMAQDNVDTRIAVNDIQDTKTFVLIFSNETYKYEESVPFALNDGKTFKLYCQNTLGIPESHIRYTPNATLNEMRMKLLWLQKVMETHQGDARAIIYYSGHGMPSEDGKQSYLLPVDGNSSMPSSGYSLLKLYEDLASMPSSATIVLLDACFGGARRDGNMLASSRGVALKVPKTPVKGNVVVFSASQAEETAYPYKEKQHGLFTYYLLDMLQKKGGYVSLGELSDYVTKQVSITSIVENDKSQRPMVSASPSVTDWRNWKLALAQAKRFVQLPAPEASNLRTAKQTTTQSSSQGIVFTVNGVSFVMKPVIGGSFMMGTPQEQMSNKAQKGTYENLFGDTFGQEQKKKDPTERERPAHRVTLNDFYLGETEVTQELWNAVMGRNPSTFKGEHRPVESVSWEDCQDFISELSILTGKRFRLPTEAEWEYAAKGGARAVGNRYAGSSVIDKVAWYGENAERNTHDVKVKSPNELGLYDLSGNVMEWCSDKYGAYPAGAQTNPKGAVNGTSRVARGGSWLRPAQECRVTFRNFGVQSRSYYHVGLRLALSTN